MTQRAQTSAKLLISSHIESYTQNKQGSHHPLYVQLKQHQYYSIRY